MVMSLPVIMHVYGGIFDILSYGKFYILLYANIFLIGLLGIQKKIKIDNELSTSSFFIVAIFAQSIMFNHSNIPDVLKYASYFVFYYYFIIPYLNDVSFYKLVVRFISAILLIDLVLYFLLPYFPDVIYHFDRDSLSFLPDNSQFRVRGDWDYSLPFYLYSYPMNIPTEGFLNIPRFFGFSAEPSLLSCIVLPMIFIAYFEREYVCLFVCCVSFVMASSYGALVILAIGLVYYIFYKHIRFITVSFLIIAIIVLYLLYNNYFVSDSGRIALYIRLFTNIFRLDGIMLFARPLDIELEFPIAPMYFYIKYGLIPVGIYFVYLFILLKKSVKIDRRIFVFALIFILIMNKSGEVVSPLFLFWANYINVYASNKLNCDKCTPQ